jgi:hypothetical protein
LYLLLFAKRLLWSYRDANGGTTSYYYEDQLAWIAGAVLLAALAWFFLHRYLRARSLRRRPRRRNLKSLKRAIKLKRQLSSQLLRRPGFSGVVHAVGIGRVAGTDNYCLQVFISDPDEGSWGAAGVATLPTHYFGIPIFIIYMPPAVLLSDSTVEPNKSIRERQEVIVGGISGAHTNLTRESGTIGYFCRRRSKLPWRKEILMLSNSHVFADLRKAKADEADLIMQPSPGEQGTGRPIGALVNFSRLVFDGEPNHIDAAIAKLWGPQKHRPVIPMIGTVQGSVETKAIELGERVCKHGRTTYFTEGTIYSFYLDIWIGYERVGKSGFFQDQLLVQPKATPFVAGGDSGSLLMDANQHAVGLLFAGMSTPPAELQASPKIADRIEGYGVANPISEVLKRLKIDLLI